MKVVTRGRPPTGRSPFAADEGPIADELLGRLRTERLLEYGYADDVAIIVRSKFSNVLKEKINCALLMVVEWCTDEIVS